MAPSLRRPPATAAPQQGASTPADTRPASGLGGGVVLPSARTAVKTRRRPLRIFGAIALILLAGLLALWVVGQMRTQYTVVEVRTPIARGHQIQATDLTTVTIGSTPGVSTVPGNQINSLVGQYATIDLASGSLLPQGAIGNNAIPSHNNSVIGLKLDPSKVMTGSITPGSKLRLVVTAAPQQQTGTTGPATGSVFPATLVSMSTSSIDTTQIVANVQVASSDAPNLAVLSAAGRLAVIKDSDQ